MTLNNSYLTLGNQFFQRVMPSRVDNPQLYLFNRDLATNSRISEALIDDRQALANIFAGNVEACDISPVALAYAGHQFGHFNPQLGDGRAHLLGELTDVDNQIRELQLKGSGQTPFSRQGDGKCALGPAIREYLMGEAMHALGVPTTRSLSVVLTNQTVYRQQPEPGAVVSRLASSHLRVGSFQYFAARNDYQSVKQLADFAIKRHYPQIDIASDNYLLQFLQAVIDKHVSLQVHWLRVGFIHGVMNTDNTTISGETIDYGPCAMMGVYDPDTVYSSIDHHGRYAFGQQANISQWNMARLAETLLPLIDADSDQAVEMVLPIVKSFGEKFNQANEQMLVNKIGFERVNADTLSLIHQLLTVLKVEQLDYTNAFFHLAHTLQGKPLPASLAPALSAWLENWHQALSDHTAAYQLMRQTNPVVIPRNHHVEAILAESYQRVADNDMSTEHIESFLRVVSKPFYQGEQTHNYQTPAADNDAGYQTFCGT
ncbi:YdiU family protein [Thalassotalea ponticola]|uniref:protein adenylyltransferase SelO n=1 Tax=Thalassotalea ponticola TaxID=1523392 RepID=UPI003527EC4E